MDMEPLMEFKRDRPSRKLIAALEKITGSSEIGEEPDSKVLSSLSRGGNDQRLRFEYLGMFPLANVTDILISNERNRAGRGSLSSSQSGLPRVLVDSNGVYLALSQSMSLQQMHPF